MSETTPEESAPADVMMTAEQVQALIDQTVARSEAKYEAQISQLQTDLASAQAAHAALITTKVPEHAGGPGTEIAETWSMAEQAASFLAKEVKLAESR
jgi:hypothetical protein